MRPSDPGALSRSRLLRDVWRAAGVPELWAVGGAVRDRLLGLPLRDLDLVAVGTLDETAGIARRVAELLGGRPHALGRVPRAVWRIEGSRIKAEIWPLGSLTPEEDALRRDFTVNAMLWRLPSGPLLDPADGLSDLASRRLRAVSRANLEADPVRLLRAARLAGALPGFRIERRTVAWIRSARGLLGEAPGERLGQELLLVVGGPDAPRAWRVALSLGLIREAAPRPEMAGRGRLRAGSLALDRLSDPSSHPLPGALRAQGEAARLGLLLWAWNVTDDRPPARSAWERSTRLAALGAATLSGEAIRARDGSWRDRRWLLHRVGPAAPAVLALAAALDPRNVPGWRRFWDLWIRRGPELVRPVPLLDAAAIGRLLGIGPGPELGAAIRRLVEAQVEGRVTTAEAARRFLLRHGRTLADSRPRGRRPV